MVSTHALARARHGSNVTYGLSYWFQPTRSQERDCIQGGRDANPKEFQPTRSQERDYGKHPRHPLRGVSTHALARARQVPALDVARHRPVSTHALARARLMHYEHNYLMSIVSTHALARARLRRGYGAGYDVSVSTHALARARRSNTGISINLPACFNPRARKSATRGCVCMAVLADVSTHALARARLGLTAM